MIPLSLYIHIPWCVKKCPYCDFNSHALKNKLPEQEYIDALIDDLQHDLMHVQDRPITSIFLGGGTPSLISPAYIEQLLNRASKLVKFSTDIEITMEVNPGTIEHHNINDYQLAGINRVSLGVQSFNDQKLELLGRIHKSKETFSVIEQLHNSKLKSFNIDLMHGLPQQTISEALQDLNTALKLQPPHISWYQLTLEPNTVFYKYPPALPDDDITWEIQSQGEELLKAAGFNNYEVSAFSKPGHECQHNLNYWSFGDYLGIGAGAHAKITRLDTMIIQRFWKTRNPKDYLAATKQYLAGSQSLSPDEIPFEYMLNRLRTFEIPNFNEYTQRTGLPLTSINGILKSADKQGFIDLTTNSLKLKPLAKRFLNDVMQLFLKDKITNDQY